MYDPYTNANPKVLRGYNSLLCNSLGEWVILYSPYAHHYGACLLVIQLFVFNPPFEHVHMTIVGLKQLPIVAILPSTHIHTHAMPFTISHPLVHFHSSFCRQFCKFCCCLSSNLVNVSRCVSAWCRVVGLTLCMGYIEERKGGVSCVSGGYPTLPLTILSFCMTCHQC